MLKFLEKLKREFLFLSIIPELCIAVLLDKNKDYKGSKYAQFVMTELEKEYKNV